MFFWISTNKNTEFVVKDELDKKVPLTQQNKYLLGLMIFLIVLATSTVLYYYIKY